MAACQTSGGAITTWLYVETEDTPVLVATSFRAEVAPQDYPLADGDVLVISNMAEHDDEFDFYLSYRVLSELPLTGDIPGLSTLPECDIEIGDDLGPACSNSSYP